MTPCRLLPGSAFTCPGDSNGDQALAEWRINCTSSEHRLMANSVLTLVLRNAVDLRVARKQSPMRFGGGFEQARSQNVQLVGDSPAARDGYRDLLHGTVVARVVTSRINAAVAFIVAAVAVVVYQLAQMHDQPSAAIALHYIARNRTGSEQIHERHALCSIACSSGRTDGGQHGKLPPERSMVRNARANDAQAGSAPAQHASPVQLAMPLQVQSARSPAVHQPLLV
jgi:hypothetical protein